MREMSIKNITLNQRGTTNALLISDSLFYEVDKHDMNIKFFFANLWNIGRGNEY